MTIAMRAGVTAIAAAALAIGLSACGSDSAGDQPSASEASTTSETAASSDESSSAATTSAPPTAAPGMSIDQYVKDNGIIATPVLRGEPGAPTINLPLPQGWDVAGPATPPGAYDAIIYTASPPSPNPPTIVTRVTKLSGDVDPAKILEYAPAETLDLPGFNGAETGQKSSLAGFDATQVGGFYTKDGLNRLIAQKTVVVPGQGGLFVVRITADGTEDVAMQMMEATSAIDEQATITP